MTVKNPNLMIWEESCYIVFLLVTSGLHFSYVLTLPLPARGKVERIIFVGPDASGFPGWCIPVPSLQHSHCPKAGKFFFSPHTFVIDYICITETLDTFIPNCFSFFFFSSFRRLACLLLVQFSLTKISPYFCGNTGELRVLTGTFKSMQFKNCQTEGDLETEGVFPFSSMLLKRI